MTRNGWRVLLQLSALALASCVGPGSADSNYPEKPIEILVGQGAGGSTDTVARTFAQFLGKYLEAPVIVRNMGGAGGRIMLRRVSAQPRRVQKYERDQDPRQPGHF